MNGTSISRVGIAVALVVLAGVVDAAEFSLVPIESTGPYTIEGNEIIIPSGPAEITLEIQLSGWTPDLLWQYLATIDSAGYTSGSQGTLVPLTDPDPSAGAFIDTIHPDYIFAGETGQHNVDTGSLDYLYTGVVVSVSGIPDPGVPKYGGTLILVVPADAAGTFTVGLQANGTLMVDEYNQNIEPLTRTPALITVGQCLDDNDCDDDNPCTDNVCNVANQCEFPPLEGAPCGDGSDTVCTAPDSCDAAGVCQPNHAPDGTPCDDGDICTVDDQCWGGGCGGTPDPVCATCALEGDPDDPINQLSFQGLLKDADGNLVQEPVNLTFRFYDLSGAQEGDDIMLSDVPVTDGIVNVAVPVEGAIFDEYAGRELGVSVNGTPELWPRIAVTSAAQSFSVNCADGSDLSPHLELGGAETSGALRIFCPSEGGRDWPYVDPVVEIDCHLYGQCGRTLLKNGLDVYTVKIRACEGGAEGGGELRLANGSSQDTIELHADLEDAARIFIRQNDGKGAIVLAAENEANGGSYVSLLKADGTATITLDGEYGTDGAGRVITEVLEITGGGDLSEQFDITGPDGAVKPGMLVSIDPAHPGKLAVSSQAYDRRVAGVVSGAGGVSPGMLMGQSGSVADGEQPVALSGRVYCWADASNGPIEPGDLLTTSNIPGHAIKVTDHMKAQGAILGKAMTSLESGRGLVLVLVSLQ